MITHRDGKSKAIKEIGYDILEYPDGLLRREDRTGRAAFALQRPLVLIRYCVQSQGG